MSLACSIGPTKSRRSRSIIAAAKIVFALVLAAVGAEDGEVSNGVPKARVGHCARRGFQVRGEIPRQVASDADDELSAAFLWHAEFPGVFNLSMDTVTWAAFGAAKLSRFLLYGGEVGPAGRGAEAEDVLHDKNPGLKEIDVTEEFAVQVSARVVNEAGTVVGAVHAPDFAKTLAGGAADDGVDLGCAQEGRELFRRVRGQVPLKGVSHGFEARSAGSGEVVLEGCDGGGVEIDGGKDAPSRALHAQGKASAAAEEVKASGNWSLAGHERRSFAGVGVLMAEH